MDYKKQKIVEILFDYESQLSDGYKWYCGEDKEDVEAKLDEIAEKILNVVLPITAKELCEKYGINKKEHDPWEAF